MSTSIVDIHKINGIRPEFDIYIGRRIYGHPEFKKSSKWCNGYLVKDFGLKLSLEFYERKIRHKIKISPYYYNLKELVSKRLGCWCITTSEVEPTVCHGQILLKLIREKGLE